MNLPVPGAHLAVWRAGRASHAGRVPSAVYDSTRSRARAARPVLGSPHLARMIREARGGRLGFFTLPHVGEFPPDSEEGARAVRARVAADFPRGVVYFKAEYKFREGENVATYHAHVLAAFDQKPAGWRRGRTNGPDVPIPDGELRAVLAYMVAPVNDAVKLKNNRRDIAPDVLAREAEGHLMRRAERFEATGKARRPDHRGWIGLQRAPRASREYVADRLATIRARLQQASSRPSNPIRPGASLAAELARLIVTAAREGSITRATSPP